MLANLAFHQNGTPVSATPYAQAVAAGWIPAGTGGDGSITQLELDRGVVAVLGLRRSVTQLNAIRAADGWHPFVPNGFGTEQVVKAMGARINAPWPSDAWETWPATPLKRASLAARGVPARPPVRVVAVERDRPAGRRAPRCPPTRRCRRR